MRAIIYYEGEQERIMFDHLLRKSYQPVHITESDLDFRTSPDHCIMFYPCYGYQNVFPDVDSSKYLYEGEETVIIARDLENGPCFEKLKQELEDTCSCLPRQDRTRLLFSRKKFEQVYSADPELFRRIFCLLYSEHFVGKSIRDLMMLDSEIVALNWESPNFRKLFKKYNMAYNKRKVAEEFFARFNFRGSTNPYFVRLMETLKELVIIPL